MGHTVTGIKCVATTPCTPACNPVPQPPTSQQPACTSLHQPAHQPAPPCHRCKDNISGEVFEVKATAVVLATGAFLDSVRHPDPNPNPLALTPILTQPSP